MSFPPPISEVWGKTFGPIGSVAGLKFYHKIGLYLIRNLSAIPSVHMNFLKCRPKERCLSAEWAGKPGIMLSCTADCFGKNEALRSTTILRLILIVVFLMKCSIWPSSLYLRKNL